MVMGRSTTKSSSRWWWLSNSLETSWWGLPQFCDRSKLNRSHLFRFLFCFCIEHGGQLIFLPETNQKLIKNQPKTTGDEPHSVADTCYSNPALEKLKAVWNAMSFSTIHPTLNPPSVTLFFEKKPDDCGGAGCLELQHVVACRFAWMILFWMATRLNKGTSTCSQRT